MMSKFDDKLDVSYTSNLPTASPVKIDRGRPDDIGPREQFDETNFLANLALAEEEAKNAPPPAAPIEDDEEEEASSSPWRWVIIAAVVIALGYGGYRYFAADDPPPEEPVASGQEVPGEGPKSLSEGDNDDAEVEPTSETEEGSP